MLRVVIDTSSLVSYVLTRGELMRQIVGMWRAGEITVLSTPATRAELAAVIERPAIQRLSVKPILLAAELQGMAVEAMRARFALDVLAQISQTMPLDPATAARVQMAVAG